MFIAVISSSLPKQILETSCRSGVSADTREAAIRGALQLRDEWERKGNGPYRIFVGELLSEVVFEARPYKEVPLERVR